MGLTAEAAQSGWQVNRVHQLEWETGEGEMDEGDSSQFHPPPPRASWDTTKHVFFVKSRLNIESDFECDVDLFHPTFFLAGIYIPKYLCCLLGLRHDSYSAYNMSVIHT